MMVLCEPKHVGAALILVILTILIIKYFTICVRYLDNKVPDIIDARCNHEVHNTIKFNTEKTRRVLVKIPNNRF